MAQNTPNIHEDHLLVWFVAGMDAVVYFEAFLAGIQFTAYFAFHFLLDMNSQSGVPFVYIRG